MVLVVSFVLAVTGSAHASARGPGGLTGVVRDDTGAVLPAAAVTVRQSDGRIIASTMSDDSGRYSLGSLMAGIYVVEIALPNFGTRRFTAVHIVDAQVRTPDATLSLTISAEVTVTAKRSFRNLAEIDTATGGLIGIADAASEGLATGRQLDARPIAGDDDCQWPTGPPRDTAGRDRFRSLQPVQHGCQRHRLFLSLEAAGGANRGHR